MEQVQVKFGEWFEKGFDLYKNNLGLLIVATLIATVLSLVSLGILAGPMSVGLILITLALHDRSQPAPEIGDLFKGFDYFLQSVLFWLAWVVALLVGSWILSFIPCLGFLVAMFGSLVLTTLVQFGLFLIADRRMEFWPASLESIEKVKTNIWPFVGLTFVALVLGKLGALACFIGVVVTWPITVCVLTVAYRDVFSAPAPAASGTTEIPPPPPQPPPTTVPPTEPS